MNLEKEETDNIYENPAFSIGRVTQFYSAQPGISAPKLINQAFQPSSVHFIFSVDSIAYDMTQSASYYTYVPTDSVNKGEKYLVVYYKSKPEMCRILFDCPITDSSDFHKYLNKKEEILADKSHNKLLKQNSSRSN